jgi:small subunit ribosomal protein S8
MDRMSEMLSSIKNASMAKKASIEVFHSRECESVAKVLKEKGFLEEVKVFKPKDKPYKRLGITLAYDGKEPRVEDVKRVSKSGRRIYKSYSEFHRIKAGLGLAIVSTSRGIMTTQEAKRKKLGGELICQIN